MNMGVPLEYKVCCYTDLSSLSESQWTYFFSVNSLGQLTPVQILQHRCRRVDKVLLFVANAAGSGSVKEVIIRLRIIGSKLN
jgi:hypothetical protein